MTKHEAGETVLTVEDLRKSFGGTVAVDGISFSVKKGEVFTIIGPNGAGKTTTLEMIEGLQEPDRGTVSVLGMNWAANKSQIKMTIGVQPQTSALFDLLTVEENLETFASFYNRRRPTDEILGYINMADHRKKRVKALSGGQKQRLAIGLAMISDPELIFLDEPTTGLDPQARRNIWDIVLKLKAIGKTTILTTHYMEEADKLSDRVCIVDQGRIVALDTPKALIGRLTKEREIHLTFTGGVEHASLAEHIALSNSAVTRVKRSGDHLVVWSLQPEETLYQLFGFTSQQGIGVEQVSIREMSLEDVFIAFTGKEWRD
ncbi:ABC transporter ATP-binding protein [Paenibacillus sp. CF384]|uniref:ABC transporter ATP-binding protein n=1 Tax=Paenibacillus sp. CF384 TaxID=1884382 RepID=UPI00089494D1|nr:ABC transporter ATP-binding protein [Paenibacillus sp. CF384]SDW85994.1 ABC-2 type transport system ATP-binding protein [Paenibacillus sp. CF384]